MPNKNRSDLKSYFVKNAIPTEGNFADLVDSQLNQAEDGVFKNAGEPLSVVASTGDQKRALRLYGNYPAVKPDWMISLNPAQDPANSATNRAGFGVADGSGNTRLFIDATTGKLGIGTNNPQASLDISGNLRVGDAEVTGTLTVGRIRGENSVVLNDFRTASPASNVFLSHATDDRDTWLYLDATDPKSNWGIYHRQINTPVANLPPNSIAFVGGGSSQLKAYVSLQDGSAYFAGRTTMGARAQVTGNAGVLDLEGSDHAYIQWFPQSIGTGRKGWIGYGGAGTTIMSVWNETGDLYLVGTAVRASARLDVVAGSRFTGDRHWFQDSEAKGRVRVGAAWGIPGFFSEDSQDIVVGCSPGHSVYLGAQGTFVRAIDGRLETQRLRLGDKWLLSGVGDAQGFNDDWLRLLATDSGSYYGGFAAGRLWSSSGTLSGSDERLKKDVAPLERALDKVLTLSGVSFFWRDESTGTGPQVGLVAQDVERVFPELVEVGPSGTKGIDYARLVAPLISAIKELHAEVQTLRAQVQG